MTCPLCNDTGYKDHASMLCLDPCDHARPDDAPGDPLERIIATALSSRSHGPVTAGEVAAAIRARCADVDLFNYLLTPIQEPTNG